LLTGIAKSKWLNDPVKSVSDTPPLLLFIYSEDIPASKVVILIEEYEAGLARLILLYEPGLRKPEEIPPIARFCGSNDPFREPIPNCE
jgi:hypothetical protein